MVPNYKTVNDPDANVVPIGARGKFRLVLHYFDPFTFAFSGITAGISQATNTRKEYGQGMSGYSKRYGADFADAFTNELFTVGVFPALLREDPRYFRMGRGGGLRRTGYALSRILVTRTDAGGRRFNFSEVMGNLASGAISTPYYPKSERGFGNIANRAGFQIGYDALFNVLKEFYPDIKKKLRRQ